MKIISAQPDEIYFLWQLELQLFNFHNLGINSEDIHVLIGYNPKMGLHPHFEQFISTSKYAQFFIYPDNRKRKKYKSSIRPNIMAQHFKENGLLENETIFYHDSDIIFRELPLWEGLLSDNTWYASDTRSYLDVNYIVSKIGEEGFLKMCAIIGIPPDIVKSNNENAGGAQYILKNITSDFWENIENDCENLYPYLEEKSKLSDFPNEDFNGIQAWCVDMWVLWWNALKNNIDFRIHTLLDFCWADSPIENWNDTYILHYTGSGNKRGENNFNKTNYIYFPPFYENLSTLNRETCGHAVANEISKYKKELDLKRIDLTDTSFLIPLRVDSSERLKNLFIVINYINKYLKTNIHVLEADSEQKLNPKDLPSNVNYVYVKDESIKFRRTKFINQLIKNSNTKNISIYDADIIVPIQQIKESIEQLNKNEAEGVIPYDGLSTGVGVLSKFVFSKILNSDFLTENSGKTMPMSKRGCGGAIFLNREKYIEAGMENEHLFCWGPDDIERYRRMEILGFSVKRIEGIIFHLPHPRGINSGYQDYEEQNKLLAEYIKISRMTKEELNIYISTWSWINA